jgi:hypothetical protein
MSQENRQPVAAPAPPRRRPEYTPVLSNREADKPQQVRDRAMAGTARTPVGFMNRSSRGAGATGVWYIDKRRSPRRRDREASSLAISAAWRSSLVNISGANNSCGACARTQTGRTCRIPPRRPQHFPCPGGGRTTAECRRVRHDGMEGGSLTSSNAESRAYDGDVSAADLFRYSGPGDRVPDSARNTAPGAYLSYDGGVTNGRAAPARTARSSPLPCNCSKRMDCKGCAFADGSRAQPWPCFINPIASPARGWRDRCA